MSQDPYRVRLRWGRAGVERAVADGDAVVVVDTLSFATACTVALSRGGRIVPSMTGIHAVRAAERMGAEIAVRRREVPAKGRFSLSPDTFQSLEPGTRVVVPSPNGATCVCLGAPAPFVLVGTLANASAASRMLSHLLTADPALRVTVVPAGERHRVAGDDGPLRVAIEDWLGAGAIVAGLDFPRSPEAETAAAALRGLGPRLAQVLRESESGRELAGKGYPQDPERALEVDAFDVVPWLEGGELVAAESWPALESGRLHLRPETETDAPRLHELHREAFGQDAEPRLVDALRAAGRIDRRLSLVALHDETPIGHLLLTEVSLEPDTQPPPPSPGSRRVGSTDPRLPEPGPEIALPLPELEPELAMPTRALALAPMAVAPAWQGQGVGSLLVRSSLAAARRRGYDLVIVLGHPEFYPRFGFVPARAQGLACPWDAPDAAWMIRELRRGVLRHARGRVLYPPEFSAVT